MKQILFIMICIFCSLFKLNAQQEQYLIAGCGFNKVAVINRVGELLWSIPIEKKDCNDVEETKEGNILFAYKYGARLVDRNKRILWDYSVEFPKEEMYTATQLKNGNFLLACCGQPARILELDKNGKLLKELKYDTGIKNTHDQFRQIVKTAQNTYLIPLMAKGCVREIDMQGSTVCEVKVKGNPFQVLVLSDRNWLVACGDGSTILEINPRRKKIIKSIEKNELPFCQLKFVAECTRLKNGNTLIANWDGHEQGTNEAPIILEIDKKNKLVWCLYANDLIKRISTFTKVKRHFVNSETK